MDEIILSKGKFVFSVTLNELKAQLTSAQIQELAKPAEIKNNLCDICKSNATCGLSHRQNLIKKGE